MPSVKLFLLDRLGEECGQGEVLSFTKPDSVREDFKTAEVEVMTAMEGRFSNALRGWPYTLEFV